VELAPREEIRTEISAKFTRRRLEADLAAAGLEPAELLTDPDELFALVLARPAGVPRSRVRRGGAVAVPA
jgi:L-histidine N-alpha-methyltransferase